MKALIRLMRPEQWIKNGFVLMPLIFSGRFGKTEDLFSVLEVFAAFCLVSSATYVLNDYADIEKDRIHPRKKNRPLARGDVSPVQALGLTAVLIIGGGGLCFVSDAPVSAYLILGAYMALQALYSLSLKNMVILDVLAIAAGFLLRVLIGAVVIDVSVSAWLILCTFSVSIFLALGKRRHEVVILGGEAAQHRPVLENYSVGLLDQLLQVVTTSTFIFYCLYCVEGNPKTGADPEQMIFTVPLVAYGIFRYMYLIYHKEDGGSPTALLLTDPPLLACTILWLTTCALIIYF